MLAHSSLAKTQGPADISDAASSSLSELEDMPEENQDLEPGFEEDDVDQGDNDTEASTERIDPSPMKQRAMLSHDPIGLDQLADAAAVDQLQVANALLNDNNEEVNMESDEKIGDPLDIPQRPEDEPRLASPGKRKRSSSLSELEDDLLEEQAPPARKRSVSSRDIDPEILISRRDKGSSKEVIEEETVLVEVGAREFDEDANGEAGSDELEDPPAIIEPPKDDEGIDERGADGQLLHTDEAERAAGAEADNAEGTRPIEDDEGTEAAAKNEDELARKKAAMDDLKPIENLFAILRDKLFDERLEEISAQIEDLRQPSPVNQDFLAKKQAVDLRRDQKIQYEETIFRHKAGALERKAIAERAIAHSQYAQEGREIRETYLDKMNTYASQLHAERRAWKAKTEHYLYRFNPKRTQHIAHQRAYNQEVSLLSGIARYHGFPAAPPLGKAPLQYIEEDLKRMRLSRAQSRAQGMDHAVNSHARPPQPLSYAAQIAHDEMAGEANFLEKNPWARPMPMTALAGQSDPRMGRASVPEQVMPTPRPLARNGVPNGTTSAHAALPDGTASGDVGNVNTETLTKVESTGTEDVLTGPSTDKATDNAPKSDPLPNGQAPKVVLQDPQSIIYPNGNITDAQDTATSKAESGAFEMSSDDVQKAPDMLTDQKVHPTQPIDLTENGETEKLDKVRPSSSHLHIHGPDRDHAANNFSPPPKLTQSVN